MSRASQPARNERIAAATTSPRTKILNKLDLLARHDAFLGETGLFSRSE
jgi:hypothetical protein